MKASLYRADCEGCSLHCAAQWDQGHADSVVLTGLLVGGGPLSTNGHVVIMMAPPPPPLPALLNTTVYLYKSESLFQGHDNNFKVWICLYTCCVTHAVHLELALDMSAPGS